MRDALSDTRLGATKTWINDVAALLKPDHGIESGTMCFVRHLAKTERSLVKRATRSAQQVGAPGAILQR
jgi:hypothetical protein